MITSPWEAQGARVSRVLMRLKECAALVAAGITAE